MLEAHGLPLGKLNHTPGKSDLPAHTEGTRRGETWVRDLGREPGRKGKDGGRTARDATGINAKHRTPIDPKMPNLPPA